MALDLIFAFISTLAGVPFVLNRAWATAVVVPRHHPAPNTWMAGPHAYESFASGGVRALLERSPMRYDVAVYLGGAS